MANLLDQRHRKRPPVPDFAHNEFALATPGTIQPHRQISTSMPRLMAENSSRLYFLAVEDIDYIESCGNCVLIHVGDHKYLRRDTLKRLAVALRDAGFQSIRKSTVINLSRVAFAEKLGRGALAFTLITGTRLVSRCRFRLEQLRTGRGADDPSTGDFSAGQCTRCTLTDAK